jgi:tetratricopeptide (TPR) repeat protein
MNQEDSIRTENEAILVLIAKGRSVEVLERAERNAKLASETGIDGLEGNCAFTLGRAAHESKRYELAIIAYTTALGRSMLLDNKNAAASIHLSMATAFLENPNGNREENLNLAILNHTAALQLISEAQRPLDYATIHHNMGFAYVELTKKFGKSLRNEARTCFKKAAESFRRQGRADDARKARDAERAC